MTKTIKKSVLVLVIVLSVLLLAIAVFVFYKIIVSTKMSEETEKRDSWITETGNFLREDEKNSVNIYMDDQQAELEILQIIPTEVGEEEFTYYDLNVQERLERTIKNLKSENEYTLQNPLAIWNPYGTGSNGLYFFFHADDISRVSYTIHTDETDGQDYSADVNIGREGEKEFLIVGLVSGVENEVEIILYDDGGNPQEVRKFTVQAPKTVSGYDTELKSSEGESEAELTDGLFYTLGTQGYYGYMFFYDNDGILRYEMLLDGYKADRVLMDGDNMLCCVSSNQIGRVNRLGQVTALYTLDGYTMHHDFNYGKEGTLLVLATKNKTFDDRVMDRVLEIDMDTGKVSEVLDLRDILPEYYQMTERVKDTDPFFWQSGTRDWIHLNTIEYTEDGGVILSSRETSTIIKVAGLDQDPTLEYLIGDNGFWEDTVYGKYVYEQAGEFTSQHGQHTTSVIHDAELEEGQYYIIMFNNNYYANSTRKDEYEPNLDESVSTELKDDEKTSYVSVYLIDEENETYKLVWKIEVPYSSIVSSVQIMKKHLIVNSGVAEIYGEYDSEGKLIREYTYESDFQGYRVMKNDFSGFWFM